ncbi:multifunctional procollagen lysine hydroxylase and glycosyltransferase LH3-like isoform X1 [Mytilus trossulus]|uniref:multifunctional procollagen lysine hydroxylase and glycosyltransferase LH3-like isoform X1 n=1 Tax=Mytilus trossulus TaxID=6551 RepID=UPI003003AFF3
MRIQYVIAVLCFVSPSTQLMNTGGSPNGTELLAVTIATDETDGFTRYAESADRYGIKHKTFGMGQEWRGGDIARFSGGGHKVNILKENLSQYEGRTDLIIMFTDSYDVVFTAGPDEILEKFKKFDSNVIFSAEGFCWPDANLKEQYPEVKPHECRFLNSGGFIGYAKDIVEMVNYKTINDMDDDQLYYTKMFLDKTTRDKWRMKLDTKSEIFQNLNGALGDTTLKSKGDHSYLYNMKTGTSPLIIHGNGPIKGEFNRIANYLVDGWTTSAGCLSCKRKTISLEGLKEDEYPDVQLSIFIDQPTPFLPEALEDIVNQDYPKKRINLFLQNQAEYHKKDVVSFLETYGDNYKSVTVVNPEDNMNTIAGRNWALEMCLKTKCQYFFSVDGHAHITEPTLLKSLIEQNRTVIAPMICRPQQYWSNFWGSVSDIGYYARSADYMDIVAYKKEGLWNVPYMNSVYLVHGSLMGKLKDAFTRQTVRDADMHFAENLRDKGIFMYVTNTKYFGHLVNFDEYPTTHLHNDMYEILRNPYDWEKKYIHPNYNTSLTENADIAQPCPDVFWFPIVSEIFCDHLIEEMEHFGQWSGGKNEDSRLAGGYENVPTVDIHMNQIGNEENWLHFLRKYVLPLQQKVFLGYFHDPPHSIMNFVVRYRPDEQPLLRPHHDSSTFTINIGLNNPGVDYTGGGCRFIRYNCSVTGTRKGWMLMHPGRLTHYHEGLKTLSGTRYIMISFVDP